MYLKAFWEKIRNRVSRFKEIDPKLLKRIFETFLSFALRILIPVHTENGKRKLSKLFLMNAISLIIVAIIVAAHAVKKWSELTAVTLMENSAIFLIFVRNIVYVIIVGVFYKQLETLIKRISSERKSMIQNEDIRKLNVEYCKNESILTSVIVVSTSLAFVFMIFGVFFLEINSYCLPMNFFIVAMPLEDSSFAWMLNFIHQAMVLVLALPFFVTYVPMTMLLVNHACWKIDTLIVDVENIAKNSNDGKATSSRKENGQRIDNVLNDLIDRNCKILAWINEVQGILKFHFLIEFTLLSFILCMSLHAITIDPFGSFEVYVMSVVPTFQLFVYCRLGNRLIVRIEQLAATVYDTKWYNMSIKQQKKLLMSLVMAQNMKGFNGIFNEVNMETFQKILDFTYSIFTLMRSMM